MFSLLPCYCQHLAVVISTKSKIQDTVGIHSVNLKRLKELKPVSTMLFCVLLGHRCTLCVCNSLIKLIFGIYVGLVKWTVLNQYRDKYGVAHDLYSIMLFITNACNGQKYLTTFRVYYHIVRRSHSLIGN